MLKFVLILPGGSEVLKITKIGSDYITVNEDNVTDEKLLQLPRVHLIKFDFREPTRTKVDNVISTYNKTNRFVISKDIKIYNDILKTTGKKFYVENRNGSSLISFFRKNNKVLLNINNLQDFEAKFILHPAVLPDVLRNVEVIQMSNEDFGRCGAIFDGWCGNIILSGGS
jgi:DNA-binding beta-propeller fold protein YncE